MPSLEQPLQTANRPFRNALLLLGLLVAVVAGSARGEATFQAWYQGTVWWRLNQAWSVGHYADFRLHDAEDTFTTIMSPRLRYDLHPRLQLQLNTSWVDASNPERTRRRESFRLEFEANPNFPLNDQFTFSMRNRFEWRWVDGSAEFDTRIRIRPQLEWLPFKKGLFRGVFLNNETIYDFDQEQVVDNRLVPFGLVFRPAEFADLRLYYMWRHTAGRRQWFDQHVAAVALTLNF